MTRFRSLSRVLALALVASAALRPAIAADRITNVAHASWTDGGIARTIASNLLDIPVETARVDMTLLREDPGSDQTQTLVGQSCPANAGAALTSVVVGVSTSETLYQGDRLIISVEAPAANTNVARIDTITATVSALGSGDRETVLLHETGPDTGRFAGALLTQSVPPASPAGDCTLGLADNDKVVVTVIGSDGRTSLANQTIAAPVDPRGKVFDSNDGGPVSGARITIVDADTGAPAAVFANDLVTAYPSTVISGQAVTDAKGTIYKATPGMYQFPRVRPGRYRLLVQPPAPYTAPSTARPADIATLVRPNSKPWTINDGSYGRVFVVDNSDLVRVDIPVDTPATPVILTKTASRASAAPGDMIRYTVTVRNPDATHIRRNLLLTDALPAALRLQLGSVRLDGTDPGAALTLAPDGRTLALGIKRLPPNATSTITYALQVRADARAGAAINRASVIDPARTVMTASAAVRITDEVIASRMTIVGRVTDGPCAAEGKGVAGVRIMAEDGSYAVTDRDGRYHFEGLIPGTHVVQADPATLPTGGRFVNCARDTRAAGNAGSRFVEGGGGAIVIADFRAVLPEHGVPTADELPATPSDKAAAGAERDWFAGGEASIAWLFPAPDHNPRAPAVRVAIRHLTGQKVQLSADGKPVDPIAFDGSRTSPDGRFAVSLWRGVPLTAANTHLVATVRNADGSTAATLTRDVHFVTAAARAEYLPARSRLLADGVHRPLIAVRLTDSAGRPVHAGSVGDLAVSAPYEAAQAIDAEQARVLSGLERAQPTWRVAGDDGVAYIALAPTTTSGALSLDFAFRDRELVRRQRLDAWLSPGDRPWTVVGLAEGHWGRKLVPLGARGGDTLDDGRLALYAKGRILGRWLMTLAYDSGKRRTDTRLTGEIDPNTYYTVYGDRSERRYDAASTRKLYLKLESRQFYALFGDFATGFTDTELGRYVRVATGLKAEYRGARVAASAFAARFPSSHRRDEIQGSGLSTGYHLLTRPILANSETIAIEVRDRLRSEKIVERRTLTRFVDYDIDYDTGAIRFSSPVLSRDSALNPQFIVAEYEVDPVGGDRTSAGARATATLAGGTLRIGATAIRHEGQTTLGALDARLRVGTDTEIRAEVAGSHAAGSTDAAWLVKAEHHDARFDVLAYARQLDPHYGVAEQNVAERGRRKVGVDGRVRLSDRLSLAGSAWTDDDLTGPASRRAAKVEATWHGTLTDLRLGATYAADHTASGDHSSTLLEAAATRRLWDNRLELDAGTAIALGAADSIDFPARHHVGARLQVTPDVTLTGTYELASGKGVDARTARVGFDMNPWAGARLTSAVASQDIAEYGRRAYAAYGLAQSLPIDAHWSLDATLDGERTLHGIDAARIVNRAQPVAAGGYLDSGATLAENFTAMTLGATYRNGPWSATGRAEYRAGQLADRAAATVGAIRQLGDGSAMGLLATWTRATPVTGKVAEALQVAGSAAIRPGSQTALLAKLEWRQDRADGVESRRVIGSLSADWSPRTRDGRRLSEVSFFAGTRYAFERLDATDIAGLTTMVGLDARFGLAERLEIGVATTARGDLAGGHYAYSYGPSVVVRPAKDMVITAGWNLRGFADRDFTAARTTRSGPYVDVKLKLDRDSFAFLGLRRR